MSDEPGIDLIDLIIRIQIHIIRCCHNGEDPFPRLVNWAIAALQREGWDDESLIRVMGDRSVSGQWWALRQLLSDKAIQTLETKLEAFADASGTSGEG